ncbi:MAG: hypothetical protein AB7P76_10040 [Candidatus Melainabacteria bacterium]
MGNTSILNPLPPLPPPPGMMAAGGFGAPTGETPGGGYGVSGAAMPAPNPGPPLAEIPPPYLVAPMLYQHQSGAVPGMPWLSPNQQNNIYNAAPGAQPNGQPAPQAPPPAPAAQPPPAQQPQPPAQPKAPEPPKPDLQKPGATLDAQTVKSLNDRMNDPDEMTRAKAGMDLFKILKANPTLANQPDTKPFVDAFLEKMLRDTSPVVHQPAFLAMDLGGVTNPSQGVQDLLNAMTANHSLMDIESEAAKQILGRLAAGNNPLPPQPEPPQGQPAGNTQTSPQEAPASSGNPQGGQA